MEIRDAGRHALIADRPEPVWVSWAAFGPGFATGNDPRNGPVANKLAIGILLVYYEPVSEVQWAQQGLTGKEFNVGRDLQQHRDSLVSPFLRFD